MRCTEGLEERLPRRLRRKLAHTPGSSEPVRLALSDVHELVERALALQEERLRAEYDRVLQEQLREQFEQFTRFNEAHLSRIVRDNDFSYIGVRGARPRVPRCRPSAHVPRARSKRTQTRKEHTTKSKFIFQAFTTL